MSFHKLLLRSSIRFMVLHRHSLFINQSTMCDLPGSKLELQLLCTQRYLSYQGSKEQLIERLGRVGVRNYQDVIRQILFNDFNLPMLQDACVKRGLTYSKCALTISSF